MSSCHRAETSVRLQLGAGCRPVSGSRFKRKRRMSVIKTIWLSALASFAAAMVVSVPAAAQQPQKPNILFIMGDDIGWMQPRIYHRGLMVGDTPNVDRIGQEGATSTWPCKAAPPAAMHRYVSGAYRHGRAADSGRSPVGPAPVR